MESISADLLNSSRQLNFLYRFAALESIIRDSLDSDRNNNVLRIAYVFFEVREFYDKLVLFRLFRFRLLSLWRSFLGFISLGLLL